jgi:predicted acyltransferase
MSNPQAAPNRIDAIDTFRGLTIFLMVFVIAIAGYHTLPQKTSWLGSLPVSTWHHAEVAWEQFEAAKIAEGLTLEEIQALPEYKLKNVGLTITDLVAPFFVFIVGLCIPLSRSRRGKEWWHRVWTRTLKLLLAGVLYISLILGLSWWWGILQAIAISYLIASLSLRLSPRGRGAFRHSRVPHANVRNRSLVAALRRKRETLFHAR